MGLDNFCDFYAADIKRQNLSNAEAHNAFALVEADIRDRDAVMAVFARHRPETVVHLAAMAGVRPSIERPALYAAVNVGGTVNLLDAAVAHDTKRFIFASSSSVYGNNEKAPFAEDDPVDHPISPYAATKKAGELICHTYCHLHRLPVTCLRFFTVFGPRQRPDLAISKFLNLIRRDEPILMFGDGSTSRDYTFIDDIIAGVRSTIDRCGQPQGYRIYNLGGKHPVTLRDMIATLERVTGKTTKIDQRPMQPGDVNRTWADLTRSEAELDYHPVTPFEDGVARQWQWYQEACITSPK